MALPLDDNGALFDGIKAHLGHTLEAVSYQGEDDEIDGVAIECMTCCMVLLSVDRDEIEPDRDYYDDSMDGDHESALASAGFGTDEDYGDFGGDDGGDDW